MDINAYINKALSNGYPLYKLWHTSLFGRRVGDVDNEYIQVKDKSAWVKLDGELIPVSGYKPTQSILNIGLVVTIYKDTLKCLDKDVKTILGKVIVNYILLESPYSGKVPYVEGDLSSGKYLDITRVALSEDTIDVKEYIKFSRHAAFLEELGSLYTPSSTEKLVLPPPGIKKFKTELTAKYVTKYGPKWNDTPTNIVEFDNELKAMYEEYLKGDPSVGVVANGKAKNNALPKKYLTVSSTNAFGEQNHITESLDEGYPEDPEKLAAMYNTNRHASYSRGNETQKGGSVAKAVLRATSSYSIDVDDCKVTYGKKILVTKETLNTMVGRYVISGSKSVPLTAETAPKYLGKIVTIRSPQYCKAKGSSLCKVCMGVNAGSRKDGIPLIVSNISAIITIASLKIMHNSQISSIKVSLDEMIK